jgi:flagellar P-ring protein precursor FlgI
MKKRHIFFLLVSLFTSSALAQEQGVRLKELCRLSDARDNALVGYGVVTGLAGTGDSQRSAGTLQSISNILQRMGVNISPNEIRSRNAAAVIVAATLPPYVQPGDKLDVNITSLGDARSLVGGTLLLTHLTGPDGKIYALAQGPISVGGFSYDLHGNLVQKNHPTAASLPGGAIVERSINVSMMDKDGNLLYVLDNPDFTTAGRIANALNRRFGKKIAKAKDAARVKVLVPHQYREDLVNFLIKVENLMVEPDQKATVVVNERTGTVVSGGDVILSKVSITQGDLKVSIKTDYEVSQPQFLTAPGSEVRTEVIPQTSVEVNEKAPITVSLPDGTTVTDLVSALNQVKASSRDIITILQAIKRSGALHAELIIQ